VEARLDALLADLDASLGENERAELREVQRRWRAFRDAHCRWQRALHHCTDRTRIADLRIDLCEGQGMTAECEASLRYHDAQ